MCDTTRATRSTIRAGRASAVPSQNAATLVRQALFHSSRSKHDSASSAEVQPPRQSSERLSLRWQAATETWPPQPASSPLLADVQNQYWFALLNHLASLERICALPIWSIWSERKPGNVPRSRFFGTGLSVCPTAPTVAGSGRHAVDPESFPRDFRCASGGKPRDFRCALYGTLGALSLFIPVVDQVENPVIGRRLCVEMWISQSAHLILMTFAQVEELPRTVSDSMRKTLIPLSGSAMTAFRRSRFRITRRIRQLYVFPARRILTSATDAAGPKFGFPLTSCNVAGE